MKYLLSFPPAFELHLNSVVFFFCGQQAKRLAWTDVRTLAGWTATENLSAEQPK
jgi:hypothetical protein